MRAAIPVSFKVFLFASWLFLIGAGIYQTTRWQIQSLESTFHRQSQTLYETIRQRLDQNEAVLSGIEALFKTFPNLGFDGIRGYAHTMLARYPHIYTVGLQPRVPAANTAKFEQWANQHISPHYQIKDFALEGERKWSKAQPRAVYYPVTFMEPPIPAASPVIGLDVYSDPKMKKAIDDSIRTNKFAASAPFPLVEGGRGYVFFKAIKNPDSQEAEHLVSLLISASKLITPAEIPSARYSVRFYHREYPAGSRSGELFSYQPRREPIAWWSQFFPVFQFERSFTTNQQPFLLTLKSSPTWEIFPARQILMVFVMSSALILLVGFAYRRQRRHQVNEQLAKRILQEEQAKAQVTLASIADAVIRVDAQGRIEYANTSAIQLLDIPLDQLIGQPIEACLQLSVYLSDAKPIHPVRACLSSQHIVPLDEQATIQLASGSILMIEGSVSPLLNLEQTLFGAVLSFRNMGPLRQRALQLIEESERKIREHQRALAHVSRLNTMGEMASGIAHELNQPLNAILNYNQASLRMLDDEEPDFTEIRRTMDQSALQSKRAGDIIKTLRAFVSKHDAQLKPVSIEQITHHALLLLAHELTDQQIQVLQDFAPDLPTLTADAIELEQVLLNLLRNAIDAMKDNPYDQRQLWIQAAATAQEIVISIRDSGPGISEAMRATIFHPFYTSKSDGMGLGLTICQSITQRYGGELSTDNHPEGGAIFALRLPIHPHKED